MSPASTFAASLASVSKTICTSQKTARSYSRRRVRRSKIRSGKLDLSPAQLAQVRVAGCDAVERRGGLVVFDNVMLDPRLLGLRKNPLPVDNPASDLSHICERVSEILATSGRNGWKFLHVLHMHQREPPGIAVEILDRIAAADLDPAQIEFHLDQVRVTVFEKEIVKQFSVDGEKLEPVVVIGELNASLLAHFPGAVEGVGGALPTVGLVADFLRNPGTDDVALADDFGGLDLPRPLVAEHFPVDVAGG